MESEEQKTRTLRVGTRKSRLAMAQTRLVCDLITSTNPYIIFDLVTYSSSGDDNPETPLSSINATGFFTSSLEEALLNGDCDIVVHSLKDLPSTLRPGLVVAAVPVRADAADCVVTRGIRLSENSRDAVVGTSSPRRSAAIRHYFPGAVVRDIRGNVDTRIAKVDSGEYDAVVLAVAGIERLGLMDRISERLDTNLFTPAAGQGALAVQAREEDTAVLEILAAIDDADARAAVEAERFVSKEMGADCQQALGVFGHVAGGDLNLSATAWRENGKFFTRASASGSVEVWRETAMETVRQLRG